MAINGLIPLGVQNTNLADASQNALLNYQRSADLKMRQDQAAMQRREAEMQFQLKDMAQDALMVKPYLESGDTQSALNSLYARAEKIRARGGNPKDTLDLILQVENGDIQGAIQDVSVPIQAASQLGLIAQDKQQGQMTEYQRRNLDLQERRLEQSTKTSNMLDLEEYQRLKAEDPEAATMFGKDVGLIPKDKPISSTAEKALIDAQDKFQQLTAQSREYELLANDYDRFKGSLPAGTVGTFSEFVKNVTGSQDEASELRRRFSKVRLAEALKYLPPGPATDRDVQEAFKGVPRDNASPEQVKAFLRGASKMARIDSEFQEFKSNYISENDSTKGLIKAWKSAIDNGEVDSINALTDSGGMQENEADNYINSILGN